MATSVFTTPVTDPAKLAEFTSQAARDAAAMGYGGESYWAYLDRATQENHAMWLAKGDHDRAASMLTRSLGESLASNNGD